MEVRQGIATEYAKEKFDVTLDEVDLARLGAEYGFDPASLSLDQVYLVLTLEANRYVLVQAPKLGRPVEDVRAQLRSNREEFAVLLSTIAGMDIDEARKRAGLEQ